MRSLLEGPEFWQWWVLAVLLLALEVTAPGALFLWLAMAAGAVGLVVLMVPALAWQMQVLLFAVGGIGAVIAWRGYARRYPRPSDEPALNRRGAQYVGQVFHLTEPILDGRGRIKAGDTVWRVAGPDLPAGTRVRLTGASGIMLEVEPDADSAPAERALADRAPADRAP